MSLSKVVSTTMAVKIKHERLVSDPQVFLVPHKSPDMCQILGPDYDNFTNMHYILRVRAVIYLRKQLASDNIIILRSSTIDLFNSANTDINLLNSSGQMILHIAFRRTENVIVFNTFRANRWESEERVGFEGHFTYEDGHIKPAPSITICDHGDRFQVMINHRTIHYFNKRFLDSNATAISYNSSPNHKSLFSDNLDVDVYSSLASLLQVTQDNSMPSDTKATCKLWFKLT